VHSGKAENTEKAGERSFGRREAKAPAQGDDAHRIVRDAKRAEIIARSLDWVSVVIDVESGTVARSVDAWRCSLITGTHHSTPVTELLEGE
jgi:hypothetical protein